MRKIITAGLLIPNLVFAQVSSPTKHIFANGIEIATVTGSGTNATVKYNHQDELSGTNIVTDNSDQIVETLDYNPFGSIRIDNGSYSDQRKFDGSEYDKDTNVNYLGARYYDSSLNRFISQDPSFVDLTSDLTDPQDWNSYSFVRNNPITSIDPNGKYTVVIPGTHFGGGGTGFNNPGLLKNISNSFPGQATGVFNWDGSDNRAARTQAVSELTNFITDQFRNLPANEPLNLVCHSHGCNVAAQYTEESGAKNINNLVSLGMPVRSDYNFNEDKIDNHVNVYSKKDGIQTSGGGQFISSGLLGNIICGLLCGLIGNKIGWGEFGPASRQVKGADYNIDVTNLSKGNAIQAHGDLIRNDSIWQKLDKSLKK